MTITVGNVWRCTTQCTASVVPKTSTSIQPSAGCAVTMPGKTWSHLRNGPDFPDTLRQTRSATVGNSTRTTRGAANSTSVYLIENCTWPGRNGEDGPSI